MEVEKVSLAYGPKQKFLASGAESDVANKVAITLPRLYFEMTGITYDAAQDKSSTQKYRTTIADTAQVKTQYVQFYDMSFELGIIAKSQDDGLQILEQILPFFQPTVLSSLIGDREEKRYCYCSKQHQLRR